MRTSEISARWLKYFEKNGHHVAESIPLLSPDPSILFTIAGMVPFIPYILGTEPAPWPRVASVQKCIRTNDIEEVGKTTRHGTFFQMGGNFSFGDYFKEGAIKYAWELLTTPVADGGYGLEGDKLWVTIWEQDEESKQIWLKEIGLEPEHLQLLPREEIFWDTGQPGPAGPCAEIHYDRGPAYGPDGGPAVDKKGDRFLEIWNLVFDQYLRGEGSGKDYPLLGELDKKAIDTGLGIERLAFLLQGKENMYEIDQVFPVIEKVQEMSGKKYHLGSNSSELDDVHMRIVADHVRSALMLICDGVRPGNDGSGYVLRRLLRRTVRSMRLLGVNDPVMPVLLPASQAAMRDSYPELITEWDRIQNIAYEEEEAFRRTLDAGTTIFDTAVSNAKDKSQNLSGADAFKLHDTYGFPIDLTLEMAAEKGVKVDEGEFRRLMQEQKDRARQDALSKKTGHVDSRIYHDLQAQLGGNVNFVGYTENQSEAKVIAILQDGQSIPVASAPAQVELVLDTTPFYAEMGGQLADHGTISSGNATFEVSDVQAPVKGLPVHRGKLVSGAISVGETVTASIDTDRRIKIAQAHTATHMVHKALHEMLGEQATQAGSENSPSRMRFDFRHGSAVPSDVMDQIEQRVNERLADDLEVTDKIMDIDAAKALGAMALFGEKYGKEVRVVSIGGDWSRELCAGTHVPTTGRIGRIAVLGESSIGSGVRRIEALVGSGAYDFHAKEHALVSQLSTLMGARPEELAARVDGLLTRLRSAEKELDKLRELQRSAKVPELVASAHTVGQVKLVAVLIPDVSKADELRSTAMEVRQRFADGDPAVVALFADTNNRPTVVVAANQAARDLGIKAGELVRTAASTLGGGGGGKPDIAQGGGQDVTKIPGAIEAIRAEIEKAQ